MNGDRYFLDTNILIYSFDETAASKAFEASQLIYDGIESGRGAISYQVAQEFCNFATRRAPQPMPPGDAEAFLERVCRPLLAVESSLALFRRALQMHQRFQLAWYDSLIVAAAQEAGCGTLYSEDFQHGQRFDGVIVQNPFR